MRQKGGYWRRPVSRTYMYNLDVGEHYYTPMTSYLDSERGTRGETPGALTFDERLARSWIHGRRYEATEARERYSRASSMSRGESNSYLAQEMASRSARSASEMRTASTRAEAASMTASRQQMIASSMASRQESTAQRTAMRSVQEQSVSTSAQKRQVSMASQREETSRQVMSESKRRIEDDICKKVADIRMSPWSKGQELDEANAASLRARARIAELERELEEITRKAMTSQTKALKTAKQMAAEATLEDERAVASSFSRTKKVMMESSSKIA